MATVTPGGASREDALAAIAAEGGGPVRSWANGSGDRYGVHAHDRSKILYCVEGSLVFHVGGDDQALTAGDRLDLPAGTAHAATVGPSGWCVEAWGP